MTAESFETSVDGIRGDWPPVPSTWSFSSLVEAEACPRRWSLSRASYPTIWARHGYPPRPALSALAGTVVHRALEVVLESLERAGCVSLGDPLSIQALRDIGGFSAVIEHAVVEVTAGLADNPRMAKRTSDIEAMLRRRTPEMRQDVQMILTRTRLQFAHGKAATIVMGKGSDDALTKGSYSEVELRAPHLHFAGRADLIVVDGGGGCVITDYKTGEPHAAHAEQLRMYALLWKEDSEKNPTRVPVSGLLLAYPGHVQDVKPPTEAETDQLAADVVRRNDEAQSTMEGRPPPALPSEENCSFCSVRHICDDYWHWVNSKNATLGHDQLGDWELTLVSATGPRSWTASLPDRREVMVRTMQESTGLADGRRVRLLDVISSADPENGTWTLIVTRSSEAYTLRSQTF